MPRDPVLVATFVVVAVVAATCVTVAVLIGLSRPPGVHVGRPVHDSRPDAL